MAFPTSRSVLGFRAARLAAGGFAVTFAGLLTGCPRPCEGAACGGLYPAAEVRIFGAEALGEVAATDGPAVLAGAAVEGNEWAFLAWSGGVVVGAPEVDAVWGWEGELDGEVVPSRLLSVVPGTGFGASVSRVEALDGTRDLLVGAPLTAAGPGASSVGAVYRFAGMGEGWLGELTTDEAAEVWVGAGAGDRLGALVAGCGDIDGDGGAEWVAGAPWGDTGGNLAGEIQVIGSAGSITTLSGGPADAFGAATWCAGSLYRDELAELVIGAPFAADPERTGTVSVWTDLRSAPLVLVGDEIGEEFGASLAVGDVDGDGRTDLVVGAPGRTGDASDEDDVAGAVYVYLATTLGNALRGVGGEAVPDQEIRGVYARGRFGTTVAVANVSGDSGAEILVGAPGHNPTGADNAVQSGAIFVFAGADPATVRGPSDALTTIVTARQYLGTGERFSVRDADSDGIAEIVSLTRSEGTGVAPR